jgi:hypothetical protein
MFKYFVFSILMSIFILTSNISVGEMSIGKKQPYEDGKILMSDLKVESVVYPQECFLGDTIYHQLRRTNERKNTVSVRGDTPIS